MDVIGGRQFGQEGGYDVGEEYGADGDGRDEVDGCRQDEDVEDVVYEAWLSR